MQRASSSPPPWAYTSDERGFYVVAKHDVAKGEVAEFVAQGDTFAVYNLKLIAHRNIRQGHMVSVGTKPKDDSPPGKLERFRRYQGVVKE